MFTARRARPSRVPGAVTLLHLPAVGPCAACSSPVAPDQRYCLGCGRRTGPLPPEVAALIGVAAPAPPELLMAEADAAPDGTGRAMVSPRAAAVAVLAMLGFGSLLGSIAGVPATSEASAPVVVALAPPVPAGTTGVPAVAPEAPAGSDAAPSGDAPAADTSGASAPPAAGGGSGAGAGPGMAVVPDGSTLPDIRHVFLIVLTDHGADDAFGPSSAAPYLSSTLRRQGELLDNYYAVTQGGLANTIALVSGQGPTPQTAAGCPQPGDVAPGTMGDHGQVLGDGCEYPGTARTLGDQLDASALSWKAYVGAPPAAAEGASSTTPAPTDGASSPTPPPTAPATTACAPPAESADARDPFAFFHAIADAPTCSAKLVDLGQLDGDLASAATTPTFSYIMPGPCDDGGDQPCAPGAPAGLAAADAWLRTVVPKILRSAAYRDGGLIAITFDQAPQTGPQADAGSCCNAPLYPNLSATSSPASATTPTSTTAPSATTPAGTGTPAGDPAAGVVGSSPGGGRVGLLLLSSFVTPGSTNMTDSYNHFSLLRSIEDLFGLDHLGYAADPAVPAFDRVVYNAAAKAGA